MTGYIFSTHIGSIIHIVIRSYFLSLFWLSCYSPDSWHRRMGGQSGSTRSALLQKLNTKTLRTTYSIILHSVFLFLLYYAFSFSNNESCKCIQSLLDGGGGSVRIICNGIATRIVAYWSHVYLRFLNKQNTLLTRNSSCSLQTSPRVQALE